MSQELQSQLYSVNLEEEQRLTQRLKQEVEILKEEAKESKSDYTIEIPKHTTEELKTKLKVGDKYTMDTIIEYLKLDNFELIKNIAKVIDKENAYGTSIYASGGLGRNEALIRTLSETSHKLVFANRKTGELQVKS